MAPGRRLPRPLLPRPLRSALPGPTSGGLEDAVGGKRVVVTGASSGIGREVALAVAAAGATTIVIARRESMLAELEEAAGASPGTVVPCPADLADGEDADRVAAEILERHGGVDILVNNAGHSIRRSVRRSYGRVHDFERTMALNYFGALRLILAFLPGMRERRFGHIVNVSTMGVLLNAPRWSAYLASKAALDAFSRSMAPEVIVDGVHVTTVYMPLVRTPMIEPTRAFDRMPALSAQQAGRLVCRALVDRPREITPWPGTISRLLYPLASKTSDRLAGAAQRLIP